MLSPLVVPKIVCSLLTSHNFDHCANSHSLHPPPAAVVFLAPLFRKRDRLSLILKLSFYPCFGEALLIPICYLLTADCEAYNVRKRSFPSIPNSSFLILKSTLSFERRCFFISYCLEWVKRIGNRFWDSIFHSYFVKILVNPSGFTAFLPHLREKCLITKFFDLKCKRFRGILVAFDCRQAGAFQRQIGQKFRKPFI